MTHLPLAVNVFFSPSSSVCARGPRSKELLLLLDELHLRLLQRNLLHLLLRIEEGHGHGHALACALAARELCYVCVGGAAVVHGLHVAQVVLAGLVHLPRVLAEAADDRLDELVAITLGLLKVLARVGHGLDPLALRLVVRGDHSLGLLGNLVQLLVVLLRALLELLELFGAHAVLLAAGLLVHQLLALGGLVPVVVVGLLHAGHGVDEVFAGVGNELLVALAGALLRLLELHQADLQVLREGQGEARVDGGCVHDLALEPLPGHAHRALLHVAQQVLGQLLQTLGVCVLHNGALLEVLGHVLADLLAVAVLQHKDVKAGLVAPILPEVLPQVKLALIALGRVHGKGDKVSRVRACAAAAGAAHLRHGAAGRCLIRCTSAARSSHRSHAVLLALLGHLLVEWGRVGGEAVAGGGGSVGRGRRSTDRAGHNR
eukprot:m.187701 g.187701  ORF g.187701 m.187701 type:complete len:431 (-) comp17526_c4_seq2:1697-2989(-)